MFLKKLFYTLHVNTLFAYTIIFSIAVSILLTNHIVFNKKKDTFLENLEKEQFITMQMLEKALLLPLQNGSSIKEICDSAFLNENISKLTVYDHKGAILYHRLELQRAKPQIIQKTKKLLSNTKVLGSFSLDISTYPLRARLHSYIKEGMIIFFLQFLLTVFVLSFIVRLKISDQLKNLLSFTKNLNTLEKKEERTFPYSDEFQTLGKELLKTQTLLYDFVSIDSLTKIYNRDVLEKQLNLLIKRKAQFSLICFNIDEFKKLNDFHGFRKGDDVLKALSKFITKKLPSKAIFGRWNPQEFFIILPNTTLEKAYAIAKNIQEDIDSNTLVPAIHFTCSFGVTQNSDEELATLLKKVDKALFMAKVEGKNRVVTL